MNFWHDLDKVTIQLSALISFAGTIIYFLTTKHGKKFIRYIANEASQGMQEQLDNTNEQVYKNTCKIDSLGTVTQLHESQIKELQKDTDKNTDNINLLFREKGRN